MTDSQSSPSASEDRGWAAAFTIDLRDGRDVLAVPDAYARSATIVYRGVANLGWPLDTAIYRRVSRSRRQPAGEPEIAAEERELLHGARRLRLDRSDGFEMTDLELLAVLQHQGAATRLLDVSFNAMISLWFATEDRTQEEFDAGLFAFDVTGRELSAEHEDEPIANLVAQPSFHLWRPPPVEARIRAQQGAFIFGRVPDPVPSQTCLDLGIEQWLGSEHDSASVGNADPAAVRESGQRPPFGVFRIPAEAKPRLREFLDRLLGYNAETLYPDLAGYAQARRA